MSSDDKKSDAKLETPVEAKCEDSVADPKPDLDCDEESKVTEDFNPSHLMDGDYVVLMETNGKEIESWMTCIRYEGNEDALQNLQDQLEKIDWYIVDDLSTYDLDLEHHISAKTAKELTKLELNSVQFHRKFDGKLRTINLGLRRKDSNESKICKVFDILGYGGVDDYLSDEDLDEEDLTDNPYSDSESSSEESSDEDPPPRRKRDLDRKDRAAIPKAAQKKQGRR